MYNTCLLYLYTIFLLEFKDPPITSCLLSIIPPLKKEKKNPTRTQHAMFQSGPSGFFPESKTCVFYTRAFSPPQGVSSILLWLSLRRKGSKPLTKQKRAPSSPSRENFRLNLSEDSVLSSYLFATITRITNHHLGFKILGGEAHGLFQPSLARPCFLPLE